MLSFDGGIIVKVISAANYIYSRNYTILNSHCIKRDYLNVGKYYSSNNTEIFKEPSFRFYLKFEKKVSPK